MSTSVKSNALLVKTNSSTKETTMKKFKRVDGTKMKTIRCQCCEFYFEVNAHTITNYCDRCRNAVDEKPKNLSEREAEGGVMKKKLQELEERIKEAYTATLKEVDDQKKRYLALQLKDLMEEREQFGYSAAVDNNHGVTSSFGIVHKMKDFQAEFSDQEETDEAE